MPNINGFEFSKYQQNNILKLPEMDFGFEEKPDLIPSLCTFLNENPNVTRLEIAGWRCNSGDALATALAKNTTIAHLKLINMRIDNAGASAFAMNSTLSYLDLSDNYISAEGAIELAKNTSLNILVLHNNYIRSAGADALAKSTTLKGLDISYNKIEPNDSESEVTAFANNRSITHLNINRNNFKASDMVGIVENPSIKHLNWEYEYSHKTPTEVFQAIEKRKDLKRGPITEQELEALDHVPKEKRRQELESEVSGVTNNTGVVTDIILSYLSTEIGVSPDDTSAFSVIRSPLRGGAVSETILASGLIDAMEYINAGRHKQAMEGSQEFRDALENLAKDLNTQLLNEENRIKFWANINKTHANFESVSRNPAAIIAQETVKLLRAMGDKTITTKEKIKLVSRYENTCKSWPKAKAFLKALACVCVAAIGFILGVSIGMGIGMAVGAWSGPGAFVTAALGAAGAARAIAALGLCLGLGTSIAAGFKFFNSPPAFCANKQLDAVAKSGKRLLRNEEKFNQKHHLRK